jgi:hypothetical protein
MEASAASTANTTANTIITVPTIHRSQPEVDLVVGFGFAVSVEDAAATSFATPPSQHDLGRALHAALSGRPNDSKRRRVSTTASVAIVSTAAPVATAKAASTKPTVRQVVADEVGLMEGRFSVSEDATSKALSGGPLFYWVSLHSAELPQVPPIGVSVPVGYPAKATPKFDVALTHYGTCVSGVWAAPSRCLAVFGLFHTARSVHRFGGVPVRVGGVLLSSGSEPELRVTEP